MLIAGHTCIDLTRFLKNMTWLWSQQLLLRFCHVSKIQLTNPSKSKTASLLYSLFGMDLLFYFKWSLFKACCSSSEFHLNGLRRLIQTVFAFTITFWISWWISCSRDLASNSIWFFFKMCCFWLKICYFGLLHHVSKINICSESWLKNVFVISSGSKCLTQISLEFVWKGFYLR